MTSDTASWTDDVLPSFLPSLNNRTVRINLWLRVLAMYLEVDGTNPAPPIARERRSSPLRPFPGAATGISRKKGCRRDAEEFGELEDLPLGERARTGQDGRDGGLRHPDRLRQLHLAEPVAP